MFGRMIGRIIGRRNTFVIFSLSAIALFIKLGFWQLTRADEKQHLLSDAETSLDQITQITGDSLYRRISLTGYFDNTHPVYLDNQTFQGRAGYHLYLPFRSNDRWILVNLGWLAGTQKRDILPAFQPLSGQFTVHGRLSSEQGSPLLLGDNLLIGTHLANTDQPAESTTAQTPWPLLLQRIDVAFLNTQLGTHLAPLLLQPDITSGVGYPKTWQPVVMQPEKHIAYAVQWFSLAGAIFLCAGYGLTKL